MTQLVSIEQAIHNIHEVYEKHFKGTKQEHEIVQQSLKTILNTIHPQVVPHETTPAPEVAAAEVVQS